MDTKEIVRERISALADGEISSAHIDSAFAGLRAAEERATWDVYHQIGDLLRSDDMAFAMRPDFSARVVERLESEPAFIAPSINQLQRIEAMTSGGGSGAASSMRRMAYPGLAVAAAAAAFTFFATPQLLVATKNDVNDAGSSGIVVLADQPAGTASVSVMRAKAAQAERPGTDRAAQRVVVLRDPRIDEYLLAHQRFSPSVFSNAQYARSATFATDSGK